MDSPDLALEPVEIIAGSYQLRPPSPRDAADLLAMAQDPEIRMWNKLSGVTDEESARDWCERWSDWNGGTSAQWNAYGAAEGKLLGTISLFDIDPHNSSAEIGYRVAPWARGQGVGTAALRSVAGWAFGALGLTRLQLTSDEHALSQPADMRPASARFLLLW